VGRGGLVKGRPALREIHRQTGVSLTTIGRVARCLIGGDGVIDSPANACSINTILSSATPKPLRPHTPFTFHLSFVNSWTNTRLKVAIQKSGRLTDNSLDLLARCGLKYSRGKDQLICYGENMPLDILLVRDDDIPDLVQQDVAISASWA